MKQKRKVKSLCHHRKFSKSFLTLSLLILGLILCLCSLSILTTSSVGAIGKDINSVAYSGIDDVTEVLYHMDLSAPGQLDNKVGEMYYKASDGTFYIEGPSMIVNSENVTELEKNEIGDTNYSNIIGGVGNKVYSDNVNVLESSAILIEPSNDNAVVLGGEGNKIKGAGGSDPVIMIGGVDNTIESDHDGDVIIGGSHNTIGTSVSNSFILGGNGNTVNADNVIVGGSNIIVDEGIDNIFVFSSNGAFNPKNSNTFYLNVAKGLGVNMSSTKPGISVKGPVRFGQVDISEICDDASIGVIGTWNECLVGCTTKSKDHGGKWELFDRGIKCQDVCDTNAVRCYNEHDVLGEAESYTSYCSKGVDISNASPCTPVWDSYNNVVFETALVNSKKHGGVCPEGAADKCIYQCNEGYYLTGDKSLSNSLGGSKGKTKCFAECDLSKLIKNSDGTSEWYKDGQPIILKHNEIVIAYNVNDTTCARDNPYLGNDKGTKSEAFPEHCGNNQHKKPLICVNGKVEIADSYELGARSTNSNIGSYTHRNCTVHEFTCDVSHGAFDLDMYHITTTLQDPVKTNTTTDRGKMTGTRGSYKLCLDYSVLPNPQNTVIPGNEVCNRTLTTTPYVGHYKWLGCNSGYDPNTRSDDPEYMCRKRCNHNAQGVNIVKKDMEKVTLYRTNAENCSNPVNSTNVGAPCEPKTFTCYDGTWKPDDGNGNIEDYRFTSCTEKGNGCVGYDIEPSIVSGHSDHSVYLGPCYRWLAWENSVDKTYTYGNPANVKWECDYKDVWYKLNGCSPDNCYHANSSKTYCEKDYVWGGNCTSPSNGGSVGSKYYHWAGTSWDKKTKQTKDTCDFYCNRSRSGGGYYKNGNTCSKNLICGGSGNPSSHYGNGEGWDYYWTGTQYISHGYRDYYVVTHEIGTPGIPGYRLEQTYKSDVCYYCNPLYHLENGSCVSDKHNCWGELPENAVANGKTYSYSYNAGWTYDNNYGECHFKCSEGYVWNGYACQEKECDSCIWNVTYDAGIGTVNRTSDSALCNNSITLVGAESECYEFVGRTDGSTTYNAGQTITRSYATSIPLTAVWGDRKDLPECQNGCKGGDVPDFPYDNMDRNGNAPGNTIVEWSYQSDKNATLIGCQWRCHEGYKKVGGTCVKQTCEAGTPAIPSVGVKKGNSEYVGTAGKKWTRVADTQTDLSECQWRCDTENNYEWKNGSGCVIKILAGCETVAKNYCLSGNYITNKVNLKVGNTKAGEKWICEGSTTTKDCFECLPGYKSSGTSYYNFKCEEYNCQEPKPTGEKYKLGKSTYLSGHIPTTWTRVSDSVTPGACQYRCNTEAGYVWNGSDCELSCGEKPIGTGFIYGSGTYPSGHTPTTWTMVDDDVELGACQYKCDKAKEFSRDGNECKKKLNYKCAESEENKYKCILDGDLVDGTNTGHSYSEFYWMCGEIECALCDDYSKIPNTPHNNECVRSCGGSKPTGEGVVINPNENVAYYNGDVFGFTGWNYISDYNSVNYVGCAWSCAEGYVKNAESNGCVSDSGCGDYYNYGMTPWLNKSKLCANGWSLDSSYKPRVDWTLNGYFCDPTFTWKCKKNGGTKTATCTQESLSVAYVSVGFDNPYNDDKGTMYLDRLLSRSNGEIASADGITAKMGYYNTITDGPYTCAINPSDEKFYDGLSSTPVLTKQIGVDNQGNRVGSLIHNFNYTPTIYTIDGQQYLLSTYRGIGQFEDYTCRNSNMKLQIFSCPDPIMFDL